MLIKGDIYLLENLKKIKNEGYKDENPRPKYESDMEPAHSIFISQVFEKYDLEKNEYPFSLARKIAVKTGIKEVLAIFQGQQNTKENFENYGVTWWEPWFNSDGDLGAAYPYNLESHRAEDNVRKNVIVQKKIIEFDKSKYYPNKFKITLGEYKKLSFYNDKELNFFKAIWENFVEIPEFTKGRTGLQPSWFCLEKFLIDLPYLPQFHLARKEKFKGWLLTPSYYNSNFLGKDTCVFLKDNEVIENIENDTNSNSLKRKELSRNQFNELLKGLKSDPFSRRHIVSFWNWSLIDKKTLVECAFETLWTCRRTKKGIYIDMTLIQRSNDVAVAGNINKMQYVALMMLVARHCGYKVGTFSHFIQNYHIYDRHLQQVDEIINRLDKLDKEDCIQPLLILKETRINDFYNFKVTDFEIKDYSPNEKKLIFELGI